MDKTEAEFVGYIKFYGPSADDGSVDIEKLGKSLVAINKIFKKYQQDILHIKKEDRYILKI